VRARLAAGDDLYHLDEGALRDLDPDLVVTQDPCAVCAMDVSHVDAALEHLVCRGQVLTVDPQTLGDVVDSVLRVGSATGHADTADGLVAALRSRLDRVAAAAAGRPGPRVAVVEWTDPPFPCGYGLATLISE
jgi:iron complex transport system substrate-binding protein